MSYIDRIKTDPVMNAVFNSKQKMLTYTTSYFTGEDARHYYSGRNRGHNEPARNPGKYARQASANEQGEAARNLPVRRADGTYAVGGYAHRMRSSGIDVNWRNNPDLYWINIIPKDLYNINYVNRPNPLISSLKNLPVHISSLHRTFSS